MDFGQLEKWCANELSGMSKSRILCILNGKPMLESSDTSETDDSGIVIIMQFRTRIYSNLNILYYIYCYKYIIFKLHYFHNNRTFFRNYLRYRRMVY